MKKVDINFDEKIKKKRKVLIFFCWGSTFFYETRGVDGGVGVVAGGCSDTNDHKMAPLDCAADRRTAEDCGGG